MNYLDEIVTEMINRDILNGVPIKEAHRIPHEVLGNDHSEKWYVVKTFEQLSELLGQLKTFGISNDDILVKVKNFLQSNTSSRPEGF